MKLLTKKQVQRFFPWDDTVGARLFGMVAHKHVLFERDGVTTRETVRRHEVTVYPNGDVVTLWEFR